MTTETLIQDVMLEVDGAKSTLQEFVKANVVDEPQITNAQLMMVSSMELHEWCYVGMVEVKRVA